MSLSRMLAAGALFALGAVLVSVPACVVANDFENGQECLRDQECASGQCTAGKCIAQSGGVPAVVDSGGPKTDTAPAGDAATDAPSESGSDTSESDADAGTDTESDAVADTADGATSG